MIAPVLLEILTGALDHVYCVSAREIKLNDEDEAPAYVVASGSGDDTVRVHLLECNTHKYAARSEMLSLRIAHAPCRGAPCNNKRCSARNAS